MSSPHSRTEAPVSNFVPVPGTDLVELALWSPFAGMDVVSPLFAVSPNAAYYVRNLEFDEGGFLIASGALQPAAGTSNIGADVVSMIVFGSPARVAYVVTVSGVKYRNENGNWTTVTGPTLTDHYPGDRCVFLPWGDVQLLFTNNIVGLHAIDTNLKTYSAITTAPYGPGHVTNFGGRVIATRFLQYPQRWQWSVKFSNTDWSGLGSGFEDMQPSPIARSVDTPLGTYPFNATQALIVRNESVNIVTATDNFDTPFRFDDFIQQLYSIAPNAIQHTPYGVVTITGDDVVLVGWDRSVSSLAKKQLGRGLVDRDQIASMDSWIGTYIPSYKEYWLYAPDAEMPSGETNRIFRYNFEQSGWVVASAANVPVDIVSTDGVFYQPYANLTGTYDAQTGTLNLLGASNRTSVVHLPYGTQSGMGIPGIYHDGGMMLESPEIELNYAGNRVDIVEMDLLCSMQDTNSFTVLSQYSVDGGSWTTYDSVTMSQTVSSTPPTHVLTFRKLVSGRSVRIRFQIAGQLPTKFRVYQGKIRAKMGPRVQNRTA